MIDKSGAAVMSNSLNNPVKNKYMLMKDSTEDEKKAALDAKKRKERKQRITIMWYSFLVLSLVTAFLYTEIKDTKAEREGLPSEPVIELDLEDVKVTQAELTAVERAVKSLHLGGSWRYEGSEIKQNRVDVYIKIPKQLATEKELQLEYINSSLCPKKDHQIWYLIRPRQVKLHLYAHDRSDNVSNTCGPVEVID